MNPRRLLCLALLGWALVLAGCSSFNRDFKAASPPAATAARKADPFSGPWDGQWKSVDHKAAGGRLRCLFTRVDAAHYKARFRANWLFFASGYELTFQTKRRGDLLFFEGQHDLGLLFGGVYRYQGRATPEHFSATYTSKYDDGSFEMKRPTQPRTRRD